MPIRARVSLIILVQGEVSLADVGVAYRKKMWPQPPHGVLHDVSGELRTSCAEREYAECAV